MIRYAIVDTCTSIRALDVEFVQLRDKTVTAGQLYAAALRWKQILAHTPTKLLINHRADVALAAGAHGVHLTSAPTELTPEQVRGLFPHEIVISASCHTLAEVQHSTADLILFGPIFEKRVGPEIVAHGIGLGPLQQATAATPTPVLALGGVTEERIPACLQSGAAGIAAIRLFTGSPTALATGNWKSGH